MLQDHLSVSGPWARCPFGRHHHHTSIRLEIHSNFRVEWLGFNWMIVDSFIEFRSISCRWDLLWFLAMLFPENWIDDLKSRSHHHQQQNNGAKLHAHQLWWDSYHVWWWWWRENNHSSIQSAWLYHCCHWRWMIHKFPSLDTIHPSSSVQ